MKKTLLLLTYLITLAIIFTACTSSKNNQTEFSTDNASPSTKDYPIDDVWVYRYNVQTKSYDFAPCGYIDEYTSVVDSTDYDLVKENLASGYFLVKLDEPSDGAYRVKLEFEKDAPSDVTFILE